MEKTDYKGFFIEALKIFTFCVALMVAFALKGSSTKELLLLLNMAVMSSSATFSTKDEPLTIYLKAAVSIAFFSLLGGVIGFYFGILAKLLIVIFAAIAHLVPKRTFDFKILINSCFVFLIFSSVPFDLKDAISFSSDAALFIMAFCLFHLFFTKLSNQNETLLDNKEHEILKKNAGVAVGALSLCWIIVFFLKVRYNYNYLYWIPLTTLLVLQGSASKIIKTSLKRIFLSTIAAISSIYLFSYILPNIFALNIFVLFIILFCMFFFRYSENKRTIFIEIYVLGLTFLLGKQQGPVVFERILFTSIGAFVAIIATLVFDRFIYKNNLSTPS